ncbi:hypothetical protein [Thiohalorhabdus sp.]|uniref:hypothetical protein n=1 Tax=Thiohalorhabdus sp. TaxID=3094134 RepID=UPI002FC345B3
MFQAIFNRILPPALSGAAVHRTLGGIAPAQAAIGFTDGGQSLSSSRSEDVADLDRDGDRDAFAANHSHVGNSVLVNQGGTHVGTEGQFADSGQDLDNANS